MQSLSVTDRLYNIFMEFIESLVFGVAIRIPKKEAKNLRPDTATPVRLYPQNCKVFRFAI
jgi:hypothetical protein